MFNPENYCKYSKIQAKNNFAMLKKYEDIAYWKNSSCESVIDLGSGDGSFTSSKLSKVLPDSCKILGVDKFKDMVQYANEKHKTDRISFKVLDIGDTLAKEYYSSFNHVFSFFAIHLARDQIKAFSNVYKLLTPGGSCFLTMVGRAKMHETYFTLRKVPKWKNWLSNVDAFTSSYAYCLDPVTAVTNVMTEVGFLNIHVKVEEIIHDLNDINEYKDFIASINITSVPDDLYDEFVNDYIDVSFANGFVDKNLRMKFEAIVVFANKNQVTS